MTALVPERTGPRSFGGGVRFVACGLVCILWMPAMAHAGEIPSPEPKRIVSINLCTDELLLRLVGPDRVAALTKFSADSEVSTVASQAKDLKRIQGGIEDVQARESVRRISQGRRHGQFVISRVIS